MGGREEYAILSFTAECANRRLVEQCVSKIGAFAKVQPNKAGLFSESILFLLQDVA